MRAIALKERTDLERRHRLRTYYEAYYKKLGNLTTDPQLKDHIKSVEIAWIASLLQPKVRHETDEPALKALAKSNSSATVIAAPTPVQAKTNQILRH